VFALAAFGGVSILGALAANASGRRPSVPATARAAKRASPLRRKTRVGRRRARKAAARRARLRRRELNSPRARAQRRASRTVYADIGAPEARHLLTDDYGRVLAGISANPAATIASQGKIVRYRNDHTAVVRTPTGLEVESSTAPLRVASGSGRKLPVDLGLLYCKDAIEPTRPVRPTAIGKRLDEGVVLTATGLSLTMVGHQAPATLIEGEEAFYGEVAKDTDAVATPKLGGVDLSALLRSVDSPEELRYRVGLPLGARLVSQDGGAVIRRGDAVIGRVSPPWARDAQGTLVPVTEQVRGAELRLNVAHGVKEYAYPILVDPELSEEKDLVDLSSEDWRPQYDIDGYYENEGGRHSWAKGWFEPDEIPGLPFGEQIPGSEAIGERSLPHAGVYGSRDESVEVTGFTMYGDWYNYGSEGENLITYPHPITHVYFDGIEGSGTSGPHAYTIFGVWACGNFESPEWIAPEAPPTSVSFTSSPSKPCSYLEPESDTWETWGPTAPQLFLQIGTDLRWKNEPEAPYEFIPDEQAEVGPASLSVAAVIVSWALTWSEEAELNISNGETYGGGNPAQLSNTDCMGGDPVNCATGNLVENQQDLSVPGIGPELNVTRTYNSQLAASEEEPGSFGWGWTTAYEDAIEVNEKCIANCEEEIISSVALAEGDVGGSDEEGSGEEGSNAGLVAAYSFDEDEGGTAEDSVGDHDGSVSGAEWTSGKFGPALKFDGANSDMVTVPSSPELELTEAFTIDAWIRPGAEGGLGTIVGKETAEYFGYELAAWGSDLPVGFISPEGEVEDEVKATESLPRETWSNVALTFDGEDMRLYVNGALIGTASAEGPRAGAGPLRIGRSKLFESGFTGKIDEVRIYDRALDAEEIQTDEAAPIGTTEGSEEPGAEESGEEESPGEEGEIREEVAVVHQYNGSTAEFHRIQGEADWLPVNPLNRADLVSEGGGFAYTLPDQTVLHFGSLGRLTSEEDENGNAVTIDRGPEGEIASVCDESGRELVYSYNPEGFVESVEDPMGHVVHYGYEGGNLVSVSQVDSAEPRWRFMYDPAHILTSVTDARGGVTRTKYESLRVVEQEDPMGRVTHWAYEPGEEGSTTTITEPNGSETEEQFNQDGLVSSVTRATGTSLATTTTYEYNPAEELTAITNSEGQTTEIVYDGEGNKIGETNPEGDATTWTYNGAHQVISEALPSGEETTIARDADGNPESISRPAPESGTQTTSYEYGPHGELESMTDPMGATWTYGYNGEGDRTSEIDPEGDERTWAYDGDSRVTSIVSPRGNRPGAEPAEFTTSIERDAQGRTLKVTDPLGGATEYAYDADGDPESVIDPNGHETRFTYDADDEQTEVERPDGAVEETGYDEAGQVITQTDGNEDETTYVRNALEEPVETVDPLGRTTTRTFDAAGSLETLTDPEGRTTTYGYDEAGRLGEVAYSAEPGQDATYGYDEDGDLTSMVDGTGESTYEYDQLGRLTHSEDGNGQTVGWEYDLDDEPISLTYPNGKSIDRAYDEAGRLESVTDWLGHTTTFSYDSDSEPTATDFPSGTGNTDGYTYDRADRMSGVTMKKGAETLASLSYARDPAGQVESLVSEGPPGTGAEGFAYDGDERLTEAGEAGYGYDAANDITEAPGTTNAYDQAEQLESTTGAEFAYDEEGERIAETPPTGPATIYGFDQAGELTDVERTEEGEVTAMAEDFSYDGNGLLASRTVGSSTKHLVWDQGESPASLLSDGEDSYVYGPGGLPFEQISSAEVPTYLHHDQLGSTRMLTDGSGIDVGTFTYGAYGTLTGKTGTATAALGYAGQYTMDQSGLQYLRARFYDSGTGQFLTRDPLEKVTRVPYGYAGDDPLNRDDPSGLFLGIPGTPSTGEVVAGVVGVAEAAWEFGTTHTVGLCVGGTVAVGIGVHGQVCVQGNLHGVGGTATVGGGISSGVAAEAYGGITVSNASGVCELTGPFTEVSVAGGEVGGFSGTGAVGTSSSGREIQEGEGTVGARLGAPVRATAGISETWGYEIGW
jgi:RHS repeat-associated protein